MTQSKIFSLPFLKQQKIAKDTHSFFFDRTKLPASGWDFIPGQYLRMTLPHPQADERGTSRYFTIASSPLEKKYVMVTTKMIKSTFKETLHNLKPGQEVSFFGPMGWFLLPKDEPYEKVFIAGGVGITPFHSLLPVLAEQQLLHPVTLFATFAKKEEVLFYETLQKLAKKNENIRVIYTLTNEDKKNWPGEHGRVSKRLLQKYLTDLQKPVFYLVGSPDMVAGTKALLLSIGIDEERIQTEDFTGY